MLEQKGALKLLLHLFREGPKPISELKGRVAWQHALYTAVEKLRDAGLVEEIVEREFPKRRLVALTEKGRRVAELLLRVEELMGG